jgi:hypothetical protein
MDNKTIFTKTAKGVGEAVGKTRVLSRDLRLVLKEVDGIASLEELLGKISSLSEAKLHAALSKLSTEDYIREFVPPTIETDTLDFVTILPIPQKTEREPGQRTRINEALRLQLEARARAEVVAYEQLEREQEERERRGEEAYAKREQEKEAARAAQQQAMKEAQESARIESEERARQKIEEQAQQARRDADAAARRAAEEQSRLEAEAKAQQDAEEKSRRDTEQQAKKASEEQARRDTEQKAKQDVEQQQRLSAEQQALEEARQQARREADEQSRKNAEVEAQRLAQEQARLEVEEARRRAEAQARNEAEQTARLEAEEQARRDAAEAEAKREAEERRRKLAVEHRAKRDAEVRAKRALEEQSRREAEERAQQEAEEQSRREAEERNRQELQQQAEQQARREAEQRARQEAEEKSRREAEERARQEAEQKSRREADEKAQREMQALADKNAEEEIRREFEELARQQAEAEARKKAEQARRQIEELAQRKAEAKAKKAEEDRARRQLEEAEARREAEVRAKQEVEQWMREAAKEKNGATPPKETKPEPEHPSELDIEDRAPQKEEQQFERDEPDYEEQDDQDATEPEAEKKSFFNRGQKAYRAPIKWGKPVALVVSLSILAGLGLIHVMAFDGKADLFEKTAAAQFQQPVKIGKVYLSLLPQPHWRLEDVSIGSDAQITASHIKATAGLESLYSDKASFKSLELQSPVFTEQALEWFLFGKSQQQRFVFGRLTAINATLTSKNVRLPSFNVAADIGADGSWTKVTIDSLDGKTRIQLRPGGETVQVELNADLFAMPFGSTLKLDGLTAKGTARRNALAITDFSARIYDGVLTGTANLQWGAGWSMKGALQAKVIDATQLAPNLLQSGKLAGSATYALQAEHADQLFALPRVEGSFVVQSGTLLGVDFAKILRGANSAGTSSFAELTGAFVQESGQTQLQKMVLNAGLLSVTGNADMDKSENLNGRLAVELKSPTQEARGSLAVAGTLTKPQFSRY